MRKKADRVFQARGGQVEAVIVDDPQGFRVELAVFPLWAFVSKSLYATFPEAVQVAQQIVAALDGAGGFATDA